eukprot:scaffold1425_cov333-Prasinococcus_capsulatus_cf.AAC.3
MATLIRPRRRPDGVLRLQPSLTPRRAGACAAVQDVLTLPIVKSTPAEKERQRDDPQKAAEDGEPSTPDAPGPESLSAENSFPDLL